jgi:hypothetical protein
VEAEISHQTNHGADGTVEFSREITIPPNFTAECTENAEALENPSVDWNTLKLCALGDLRVDKSLVFKTLCWTRWAIFNGINLFTAFFGKAFCLQKGLC